MSVSSYVNDNTPYFYHNENVSSLYIKKKKNQIYVKNHQVGFDHFKYVAPNFTEVTIQYLSFTLFLFGKINTIKIILFLICIK